MDNDIESANLILIIRNLLKYQCLKLIKLISLDSNISKEEIEKEINNVNNCIDKLNINFIFDKSINNINKISNKAINKPHNKASNKTHNKDELMFKEDIKKKQKVMNKYENKDRCQARIYNVKNLISKDKNNNIIYGMRCTRKKEIDKLYCYQHLNSLTHGDYLEEPTTYLKEHFKKGYIKYIKDFNIPINNIINF
jgi:hypothetical protein